MSQPNQVSLQIEEESPTESAPRHSVNILRLDSVSRPVVSNRNNLGIGDRLNNVFREIRPLVEQARMGNNARLSLPTWLPRNQAAHSTGETTLQRPQSSIAQVNLGPNAQTFIITERIGPGQSTHIVAVNSPTESNPTDNGDEPQEGTGAASPGSNNNGHSDSGDNDNHSDDEQQVMDVRALLHLLIKYAPFYLILFIKFMYDCREGLFTFFVLFCTFIHSNSLVRREHGKQTNRSLPALFFELVFTAGGIYIVHFLFGHGKLLPNLIMFPPYEKSIDVWELIWLVCLTDLIVKIITVDIKILITMLPAVILPFQKRGKVYLFIEALSQLYRSLLTIQPWAYYLMESYEGSERMVGMFLTSVYVISKIVEILLRLRLFKTAAWTLIQSANLGTKPTREQLTSAGETCPICHDEYCAPVRLSCGHIYCELCIAAWLDREHTCPLCRAPVADLPAYRDGSTTLEFQLY